MFVAGSHNDFFFKYIFIDTRLSVQRLSETLYIIAYYLIEYRNLNKNQNVSHCFQGLVRSAMFHHGTNIQS